MPSQSEVARRDPYGVVTPGRPVGGRAPRRSQDTLATCCNVAGGLMVALAVLVPLIALVIFIFSIAVELKALFDTASASQDPVGATIAIVAVVGTALASGLGVAAFLLVCSEVILIVGAIALFLIGRRLRRGRSPSGPRGRSVYAGQRRRA
jgi:uncharacterized membrane protein YhaH (DUF805 family)